MQVTVCSVWQIPCMPIRLTQTLHAVQTLLKLGVQNPAKHTHINCNSMWWEDASIQNN